MIENPNFQKQTLPFKEPGNSYAFFLIEQEAYRELDHMPKEKDPVFWPVEVLEQMYYKRLKYFARVYPKGKSDGLERTLMLKIDRVKTAYQIHAYPYIQNAENRAEIKQELYTDYRVFGKKLVQVQNIAEREMLQEISKTRSIPFNWNKYRYEYSEVLGSLASSQLKK